MRALILSVSAGGGHIHAAQAIETYITINEPDSVIEIIDTLKYINPLIDKVVIGSYLKSIKVTPSLFGKLYVYTEKDEGLANVSNKINKLMAYRILPFINEFNPDIIIATHPFPNEMLSILKLKNKITMPCICVLTDYAPHNSWLHPGIDGYVVSNEDMVDEMAERGIPRKLIHNLGIPISPEFITKHDRKTTLKSLGLNPDKITLLVMGGSLGLGKITNIYEQLDTLNKDVQIIVITGDNKKLFTELKKLQPNSNKNNVILGYTKDVNKYMQSCDLLITKPGGLTITEALVSKTPLALFSPIPGPEEKNAEFLVKHNLAINMGNGKDCKNIIDELLSDPYSLNEMRSNCNLYSNPNSGNDIYNLMKSLIKQ